MATEKWVANTGSDDPAVPGTEQQPYKTVQHGVDILKSVGGGILHVKVGFYNENVTMRGNGYSNISVIGYAPPAPTEGTGAGGPCDQKPVIDGSTSTRNHRVFDIADCTGVVLQNLTIQNGSEVHTFGDEDGGGVLAESAQVDLIDCCILNNHAGHGGGFAYLNCQTGKPSKVQNCIVRENDAAREGGGAYLHDSKDLTVSTTTFTKNTIADGFGGGGMCIRHSSKVRIGDKCTFEENQSGTQSKPTSACNGGAIYLNECTDAPATIYIGKNNTFSKNTAKGRGGAIHMLNNVYAEINGNEFKDNVSQNSGGAIGCVQVTGLSSGRDVATEKPAGRVVSIIDNNIHDNQTETTESGGGGIYASATAYIVLQGNTIEKNASKFNGGGMHITYNSFLEADGHNKFIKNTAENNGGGLSSRNSHIILNDENSFLENEAQHDGGGTFLCTADEGQGPLGVSYGTYLTKAGFRKAVVTVQHSNRFERNKSFNGAGFKCEANRAFYGMAVTIDSANMFIGNKARAGGFGGGGFFLAFLEDLTITGGNEIRGNEAPDFQGMFGQGGGGLIIGCFDVKVDGNQFVSNQAGNGPGLKLRHCGGFKVTNNTLKNNRETTGAKRIINIYFNACNMGTQTAATVAAANPPLAAAEILIYP